MKESAILVYILMPWLLAATPSSAQAEKPGNPGERKVSSADGIEISYSVSGKGEPALVFIHGGFANRSFWKQQLDAFAPHHRVIALDLAGHGQSGRNRKTWNLFAFAEDVCAVLQNEKIKRVILIGNSMGGPVALETALRMPGQVEAVVAVDTFQDLSRRAPAGYYQGRAKAFREDFSGTMKQMVRMLFHAAADPALVARVEEQMLKNSPDMAAALMESFAEYDQEGPFKKVTAPIRCINGDLFPTNLAKNRELRPDFDAAVLPHLGHYPMLENPSLFNQTLEKTLQELAAKPSR